MKYKVTFEVDFPTGTKPHPIFVKDATDETEAEKQVKLYWILDRELSIGRCLEVKKLD